MPFLRYYNVPGTDFGSNSAIILLLCIITTIVCLFNKNSNCSKRACSTFRTARIYYAAFLFWCIIVTFYYEYGGLASNNINNSIIALFSGYVILMLLSHKVYAPNAFKMYEILVFAVLVILGFQWILTLLGISMSFQLPFHSFNDAWNFQDTMVFGMGNRANTSLFSEPAHLAEFLLPYLCYVLLGQYKKKNKTILSLIVSFAIVISFSGTGIVLLGLVWILYLTLFSEKSGSKKLAIGFLGIVLLVTIFIVVQTLEEYGTMFQSLFFSSDGSLEQNKSSFRIYRGWDYVFKMPFKYLLTGVGYVHMEVFSSKMGIWSIFDDNYKMFEWFSAITEIILYFGIIGLAPFILHLKKLYKGQSNLTKSLIIVFICLLFTSQILFQETQFFYLALIVSSIYICNKQMAYS